MVDDKTQRYVFIDNNRLKDEIIYHRYYGQTLKSNSFLSILLPLILSNINKEKSEIECISLIKKYVNILNREDEVFDYIFSSIIYNSVLNDLIKDKNLEYEDLLQNIKVRIIENNFSETMEKKDIIKFQIKRIDLIKKIDNYINKELDESDNLLNNIFKVLYSIYIEEIEFIDFDINNVKKSILSVLGTTFNNDNTDFILSMANYIIKIRNYNINKTIYNQKSDPRYLISLNEGDEKIDPIFGKVKVEFKSLYNNTLHIKLKSKSGIYDMKFLKSD